MYDLDKAADPVQRAEWARANLIDATRTLKTALRELQQALYADNAARRPAEGNLVEHLDAVAAVWFDAQFDDDDPYAGLTNADVLSADELYDDERALEAALDAADEERFAAESEATDDYQPGDEHDYEGDDEDEDDEDESGPF